MEQRLIITLYVILFILSGEFCKITAQLDKYDDYNGVITNLEFSYVIDFKNDSLSVSQTNTKLVRILNDKSKGLIKDYIFYSSFASVNDLEACTLVAKGNGFTKIKVEQFQEASGTDRSVFYDDSKTIRFAYPSVQNGSVTSLKYTLNYKDPRFIRRCFLQSYLPVENVKVIVKVHRDIELGYKSFNFDHYPVSYKAYSKGKYNYYEWEASDVEPYAYQGSENYGISYYSPHIAFYIKSVNIGGLKKDYFGTPDLLYHYYYGFVKGINKNISSPLKLKVQEITNGLSDSEKGRAIYYWVHNNIKYVAYEDGYSGFIPAEANDVFTKRYGDCKGMSSLLQVMMNESGLDSHIAWVGTRSIPYTYEEIPLPSVDNHMVAVRFEQDSLVVLDGTFKYLDYGVYPYHIQGKEILVESGPDDFKICKVPVSPASYSVITDSAFIRIEDNKVVGDAKAFYTGFNKLELAYTMEAVKPEKYENTYSRIFNKGNNKFKVTEQKTNQLFQTDTTAEIDYAFEIEDYYKQVGDEIYFNLNIDKPYSELTVDTLGRIAPLENSFYCTEKYVTTLNIPDGYKITYIPEDDSFSNDLFGYKIHYSVEGKEVVVEKEMVFRFFILLKDHIAEWNTMIRSLNKNYRNTLVLKRM